MIRNPDLVRRFEDDLARESPLDYHANLAIFEAMWEHARKLGALPACDPLEGIELDIRLAGALNVRKSS